MLVVDASVVIKWFLDEPLHAAARHIYRYQQEIVAPDFVLVEVANVAWKKVRREEITADQAREIVSLAAEALPVLIPASPLLSQATELALELDHPVYDCLYLACLRGAGDLLVTADRRFFNKLQPSRFRTGIRHLDDADLALPLHVPLHKIAEIVRLSGLIEETHRNLVTSLTQDASFPVINASQLQPLFDSPAFRQLGAEIANLPIIEQADILALGWLGRGYDGQTWDPIRAGADRSIRGNDKQYIRYVAGLAIYVEQGLNVLRKVP